MSKTFLGFICGIIFGILDVLLMIPAPIPEADKPRAMAGAFVTCLSIGFVTGAARLDLPGWAGGMLFGLLGSLPSAIITQKYIPIIPVAMVGGAVIGFIVRKMGEISLSDEISSAYNSWSRTYDTAENRTRDLAGKAVRAENFDLRDRVVLELGCGTGRNTGYLAEHAHTVTAMDFSEGMLTHARANVSANNVHFIQQDLNKHWNVGADSFDLIVCTLVLEHIENLEHIFHEARRILRPGGEFLFAELHPFRQLTGGQAQFAGPAESVTLIPAFIHYVSDYVNTAIDHGFEVLRIDELSDEEDKANNAIPRLICIHMSVAPALAGA